MLSIFIVILYFPSIIHSSSSFTKLQLPSTAVGPESFQFINGGGPYTSVSDGRILKYEGPNVGFVEFAFTSQNWSKAVCEGTSNPNFGGICGRPVGLAFNPQTKELFVTDAYNGLMVVEPNHKLATQIANGVDGRPFGFPNAVDIDLRTGIVYFTDTSKKYTFRDFTDPPNGFLYGDATGKLLKYDPKTKQITLLLKELALATGVAVSMDSTYVLVTEFGAKRVQKYWLTGPKANTVEILVNVMGNPSHITRTIAGYFWVAVNNHTLISSPAGIKINGFGEILETILLYDQYNTSVISEVLEFSGDLYVGSLAQNFVGLLKN